jgi:hypothetical protein
MNTIRSRLFWIRAVDIGSSGYRCVPIHNHAHLILRVQTESCGSDAPVPPSATTLQMSAYVLYE